MARRVGFVSGPAWLEQPTEPGWYWMANGPLLSIEEVFTRPGHSYLAIQRNSGGLAGKREFYPVVKFRDAKWLRIEPPVLP